MSEWSKNLAATLLAAFIASGVTVYASTASNSKMIEQLSISTDKLSEAVIELKVAVSAQDEKFVTKDQLHQRFREFKEELK